MVLAKPIRYSGFSQMIFQFDDTHGCVEKSMRNATIIPPAPAVMNNNANGSRNMVFFLIEQRFIIR
jgi:hypothetical protein